MLTRHETLSYVIADLRDRAEVGFKKYGHAVEESPDDMLQHAYHEALDLCMYLRTEMFRQGTKHDPTL